MKYSKRNNKVLKSKSKQVKISKQKSVFIQRAKINEKFHRRQKLLEDKFRIICDDQNFFYTCRTTKVENELKDVNDKSLLKILLKPLRKDLEYGSKIVIVNETLNKIKGEELKLLPTELSSSDAIKVEVNNCSFSSHLDYELTYEAVTNFLLEKKNLTKLVFFWPVLKCLQIEIVNFEINQHGEKNSSVLSSIKKCYSTDQKLLTKIENSKHLVNMGIKMSLAQNIILPLSNFQSELLKILNNYQDLYFSEKKMENTDDVQTVYCLHALNHLLKTKLQVIYNNSKIKKFQDEAKSELIPDLYRDQGLTRPKILFVLPHRNSAFNVINKVIYLLYGLNDVRNDKKIINYSRFVSEYTGNKLRLPKLNPKPQAYEKLFEGNTNDNFRIGLSLSKKNLKLYTDFYASDILVASPLGLRTIIGTRSSKDCNFDFLNSIELLIVDEAEVIVAQNWEHILHLMDHMHLPLQNLHDADLRRVRPWYLNGFSRFYRQTILFSTHDLPEFRGLFDKCNNYRGRVIVSNPVEGGDIRNVIISIPQIFQRIDISDYDSLFEQRFTYFIKEVLPKFRSATFAHCLLYIPSYFDFTRIRNYFKQENISFVQICEYSKQEKVARARDLFFHSGAQFLLYSERSHFFMRTRIKGIRHLIMYQVPQFPSFYSEIINFMHENNQNHRDGLKTSMSVTVLYTKYERLQLNAVVGNKMATCLLKSGRLSHVFVTNK